MVQYKPYSVNRHVFFLSGSDAPFRLGIILAIVAVLLLVAAIIVCKFACVNFCQSKDGYGKIGERDDDDAPKEVIVETPPGSETEDLESDSEVKQPLPETDPPDDDENEASEPEPLSPTFNVAVPPRYSHVSMLPRYSQVPDPQGEPEAERTPEAAPTTPLTEKEISNDLAEKKDADKDNLAPVGREDGDQPPPSPREEEARSSGDEVASPGTSNGTPPPPYDEARSRGSSEDRLDELEDSSPENSAPIERDEDNEPIADTSSDSEDVLLNAAANAPTLERPHILKIDEPDAKNRGRLPTISSVSSEQPEGATAAVPPEEGFDEVDGHHDEDELNSPSPTVPLDPVVMIESPGDPDESFENDDYIPPRRPGRPRHTDA